MQGPFSDSNANRWNKSQPPDHKELYIAGCLKPDNHFLFLGGKVGLLALKTTMFIQLRVTMYQVKRRGVRGEGKEGGSKRKNTH